MLKIYDAIATVRPLLTPRLSASVSSGPLSGSEIRKAVTPRRERLKASDQSSPKTSAAQQIIEKEPAAFRAAVEAKECVAARAHRHIHTAHTTRYTAQHILTDTRTGASARRRTRATPSCR